MDLRERCKRCILEGLCFVSLNKLESHAPYVYHGGLGYSVQVNRKYIKQ